MQRSYLYDYDALDRITGATASSSNYNLGLVEYDKMGNITRLTRNGHRDVNATTFGLMDDLTYQYDGNQLKSIDDAPAASAVTGFIEGAENTTEYQFDGNGNMTRDDNKKITAVEYNYLNMPTKVTVTGSNAGVLDFVYAADGTKLRKLNSNGTTTDYAGNYVYENGNLKQFDHPEGYVEPDGSGWQYVYRYTDMWGNTRITYADDNGDGSVNSSEIRREQNYYPFGMEHRGYNSASYGVENNLRTYQSQEFTEDLGLNVHEWRYRMSDPSTGRFWQIDPLAEDFMYNSTYAFQENKLGSGIELEGLETESWDDLLMDGLENGEPDGSKKTPEGATVDTPLTSAAGAVFGFFGAIHNGAVNVLASGISSIMGTAEAENVLSDSEFNTAVAEGDENAFYAGLEVESAAAYNAAPEIAAEAIITFLEMAGSEISVSSKAKTKKIHGNSVDSPKPSGFYELTFESGKTYNGVGLEARMNASARKLEKIHKDRVVKRDHTATRNRRDAYIQEHLGIQRNGGAGNTKRNYNKNNSPGKKLVE